MQHLNIQFITNQQDAFSTKKVTVDDVVNWCKNQTFISVDTETKKEDHNGKNVIAIQIGNKDIQYVIDTRNTPTSEIQKLKPIFESKNITKIFHNAKFDVGHLRGSYGWILENVYCTMVADCVIHCGYVFAATLNEDESKDKQIDPLVKQHYIKVSLKALCERYLQVELNKEEQGSFSKIGDKPYNTSQIQYMANDVVYLYDLYLKQQELIKERDLQNCIELEQEVLLALSEMEFNGIKLNEEKWKSIAINTNKRLKEIERELEDIVLSEPRLAKYHNTTGSLFEEIEVKRTFVNFSSAKQIDNILTLLGIPHKGTGYAILESIKSKHKLIDKLIEYRKQDKLSSTYGFGFLDNINSSTGRVHTRFWQVLETGRISSGDKNGHYPNLQNIPAQSAEGKLMREAFEAEEGNLLVIGDYSGQELRLIAAGSKEQVWIDAFNNGGDIHASTAISVFKVSRDKVKDAADFLRGKSPRFVAKSINFALAYGATAKRISSVIGCSVQEAQDIINKYFAVLPNIKKFLSSLSMFGRINGYIRTFKPIKRTRWFKELIAAQEYINEGEEWKAKDLIGQVERASCNTPIQGGGADLVKLALVRLRRTIINNNYPVKLILQVHDEIVCEARKDFAKQWKQIMHDVMVECGKEFVKELVMEVDVKISHCWEK